MRFFATGEMAPGDAVKSDREWEEHLRSAAIIGEHPIGTCKMGNDRTAVVTPDLEVRGLRSVRVVDASVMPTLITGHTNAPTIMIAERASDLIRASAMIP